MNTSRIQIIISLSLLTLIVQIPPSFGQADIRHFSSIDNPVGIAWKGNEFLVSLSNGETKLFAISSDGANKTAFAPSFSAKGDVHLAVSDDISGFHARNVYINSGDTVYHADPRGRDVEPFATPAPGVDISYISFDEFGYWGSSLLVATVDGRIWLVNSDGESSLIANLDDYPLSVVAGPDEYGTFTGHILVSLRDSQRIVGISPTDHSVKVLAEFPGEIPRLALVILPFSNLFFTNTNDDSISIISKDAFTKTSRFVIVFLENEEDKTGSIKVIEATRDEVKISDLVTDIENPSFGGATFALDEELLAAPERKIAEEAFRVDPVLFGTTVTLVVLAVSALVFWKFRRR